MEEVTPTPNPRLRREPPGALLAPDSSAPLDVDAVIAQVPVDAQIKGFFVASYERMLGDRFPERSAAFRAVMPRKSYASLHSYARGEVMRTEVELSRLAFPDVSLREALRRSTQLVYPTFLSSTLGRVVLATVGRNVDTVLGLGPRMMSSVTNFGAVTAEQLGERHWRYHYRDYYSWLDCGDVGVIEGLLKHYGQEPELTVCMQGPFEMWLDIRWRPLQVASRP